MLFPSKVMMYVKQNGMEMHTWRASRTGMPVGRKGEELVLDWLVVDMSQVGQATSLCPTLVPCNSDRKVGIWLPSV